MMLTRQVLTILNRRQAVSGGIRAINTTAVSSITIRSTEEPEKPKRTLKKWRSPVEVEKTFLQSLNIKRDKPQEVWYIRNPLRFTTVEMKEWFQSKKVNYAKFDQRFQMERHQALGCDLAAAHFIVFRGGKIKFEGEDEWRKSNEDRTYDLPTMYEPQWKLTHLDASGIDLYYEGFENFINLKRLVWVSFRNNQHLDDWCIDRISGQFPNMECLDVSECPKLTERGLEALYRSYNLKKLIITDWNKQPSFELTCLMLEDCNPELTIEIRDPPEKNDKIKNKNK